MLYYDILVVGAGPAGSSAAAEAAREGAKVLLVEKKKVIGQPVQCGEFIPKLLLNELDTPLNSIVQELRGTRTYLPSGECFESDSPGYILKRDIFDKELAMAAINSGAEIFINTWCLAREGEKIIIKKNEQNMEVIPKVIIGADGPNSTVGKWINNRNKDFAFGLQYELPLTAASDYTEIYFDQEFFAGYGWLFPKGKSANVGIGIRLKPEAKIHKLRILLGKLVSKLEKEGKIKNHPISVTAGLIPVGGPLPTVKKNIMLVGDAAGQTHPISGGGIPQAVICGKIAGKIAAYATKKGRIDLLTRYEEEWQKIFQEELERGKKKRQLLESHWHDLDNVLKRCWISFREYYYE